uniref:C2H2-type domain-containing protein n=1 Tax=Cacopsylla melanoneura TaxID=428564 RepID=A0A8D8LH60_9HEMI
MLLDLRLISQSYQLFVSIRQKKTKEQLKEQKMDEFVITNVMTRRVSERIKERESFLILVEEYSSSDTDNEVEDTKPSSPKPKRVHSFRRNTRKKKQNSSMQSSDEDDVLLANLKRHCKLHDGKKFICAVCDRSFSARDMLQSHMITHNEQRETKSCKLCNVVVMRSSYSLHCKTVKHCQNLKESRRKSRKKITISRET